MRLSVRAGRRIGLPLPHVPEGGRRAVHRAGARSSRSNHLDARQARRHSAPPASRRGCSAPTAARRSPTSAMSSGDVELTTGSFDEPERLVPTRATGDESRLHWIGKLPRCPARPRRELHTARNKLRSCRSSIPITTRRRTGSRRATHETKKRRRQTDDPHSDLARMKSAAGITGIFAARWLCCNSVSRCSRPWDWSSH